MRLTGCPIDDEFYPMKDLIVRTKFERDECARHLSNGWDSLAMRQLLYSQKPGIAVGPVMRQELVPCFCQVCVCHGTPGNGHQGWGQLWCRGGGVVLGWCFPSLKGFHPTPLVSISLFFDLYLQQLSNTPLCLAYAPPWCSPLLWMGFIPFSNSKSLFFNLNLQYVLVSLFASSPAWLVYHSATPWHAKVHFGGAREWSWGNENVFHIAISMSLPVYEAIYDWKIDWCSYYVSSSL